MLRALIVCLMVLLLGTSWSGDERLPLYDGVPNVTVTPVPLDGDDPARRRVGALTYLGGLRFASRDAAFGGYSSLAIDGDRFTLLSDGGLTFGFRMRADLRPGMFTFGALPDGPGVGWRKRDRDSEALTVDPATGRVWIGFESHNAVWRYAPGLARAERGAEPAAMHDWPRNGGAEAMVRLRDGRFLIFAEGDDGMGADRPALTFDRDPTDPGAIVQEFRYRPPAGYFVTDAAQLPDGRLLVLTRAFTFPSGFTAKLMLVDTSTIRAGAVLGGRELATLTTPTIHDNFEGVAVTREGAATIVWLLSDDNGPSLLQRTMLLKFRLEGSDKKTPRWTRGPRGVIAIQR